MSEDRHLADRPSGQTDTRPHRAEPDPGPLPLLWFWLGTSAALLAAVGSAVGLVPAAGIYGRETTALADAATAQDLVNLLLVAPFLVILGRRASTGHVAAFLVWLGCLAFTCYNYAIYAFALHFGPLFLVWVVVLGLSTFALIGGIATADMAAIERRFVHRSGRGPAWLLLALTALFTLLWLSEIVPDALSGAPSRSASAWQVPSNPVHVLDLAFFLPAAATSGYLLLRRHRLGYTTAPGQFTWLALTCLPIMVTPLVADVRGHQPDWTVTVPIAVILLASLGALAQLLRQPRVEREPTRSDVTDGRGSPVPPPTEPGPMEVPAAQPAHRRARYDRR